MKVILLTKDSKQLRAYIDKYLKGSIDISYAYDDLMVGLQSLRKALIDIDKLVLDEQILGEDFADNISMIKKLLETDYFNCKEVIYLGSLSNDTYEFVNYSLSKFTLNAYEYNGTVTRAVECITGKLIKDIEREHKKLKLVRKSIGSRSDVLIKEDKYNDSLSVIIGESKNILDLYEKMDKDKYIKADKGKTIKEIRPTSVTIPKLKNVTVNYKKEVAEEIVINEHIATKPCNVIGVTGLSYTGKSIMSMCLGVSASNQRKVLMLDCSTNMGLSYYAELLHSDNIQTFLLSKNIKNLDKLITDIKYSDKKLNIITLDLTLKNKNLILLYEMLIGLLRYNFDDIILDIPLDSYTDNLSLFNSLTHMLITTPLKLFKVIELAYALNKFDIDNTCVLDKLYIIPTGMHTDLTNQYERADVCVSYYKKLIKKPTEFFGTITLKSFNIDYVLYKTIIGG